MSIKLFTHIEKQNKTKNKQKIGRHCVWINCSTLSVWERLDFVLDLIHFLLCCVRVWVFSTKLFTRIKNKTKQTNKQQQQTGLISSHHYVRRPSKDSIMPVRDFAETFCLHNPRCVDRHWKVEVDMENRSVCARFCGVFLPAQSMLCPSIVTRKLKGTWKTAPSVRDFVDTFCPHNPCCVDYHWKVEMGMENRSASEVSVYEYFYFISVHSKVILDTQVVYG